MTGKELREAMQYRGKMIGYLNSGYVMDGADDWIRMELHNQQREMQAQVAAEMRREHQQITAKKVRPAGQGGPELRLRQYLKSLIMLILMHPPKKVKG